MRSIKLVAANVAAIQAALDAVNGDSTAHTLRRASDVLDIAAGAEARVVALVGAKSRAVGAAYSYTSGDSVANAYQYGRRATRIEIKRRPTGWYLDDCQRHTIYCDGGRARLTLTVEQDAAAVAHLRKAYSIATADAGASRLDAPCE